MEGDMICLHDIFRYEQTGVDEAGSATGHFEACGVRPLLLNRLIAKGEKIPPDLFTRRVLVNTTPGNN